MMCTAFSYGPIISDELISDGRFELALFHELGPGLVGYKFGFEVNERASHQGEVCVEIPVFGARFVFSPEMISNPVVSDFASTPVAAYECGEVLRGGAVGRQTADIKMPGVNGLFVAGEAGFVDDDEAEKEKRGRELIIDYSHPGYQNSVLCQGSDA